MTVSFPEPVLTVSFPFPRFIVSIPEPVEIVRFLPVLSLIVIFPLEALASIFISKLFNVVAAVKLPVNVVTDTLSKLIIPEPCNSKLPVPVIVLPEISVPSTSVRLPVTSIFPVLTFESVKVTVPVIVTSFVILLKSTLVEFPLTFTVPLPFTLTLFNTSTAALNVFPEDTVIVPLPELVSVVLSFNVILFEIFSASKLPESLIIIDPAPDTFSPVIFDVLEVNTTPAFNVIFSTPVSVPVKTVVDV